MLPFWEIIFDFDFDFDNYRSEQRPILAKVDFIDARQICIRENGSQCKKILKFEYVV
jgi:hypothetical protein